MQGVLAAPKSALSYKILSHDFGTTRHKYQAVNRLRFGFWRGWLAARIAKYFAGLFGFGVITSELKAELLYFNPEHPLFGMYAGLRRRAKVLKLLSGRAVRQARPDLEQEYTRRFEYFAKVADDLLRQHGHRLDLGVLSNRVVTTAGVGFIVDAWQNSVELENMKYHGVGTGTNAEAASDTALQTESTTILNPDSTRATGTQSEASATAIQSVATVTFDGSGAITEHGILSQSATGGGVLWDRSIFSAINVVNGMTIVFTYTCTFTGGG